MESHIEKISESKEHGFEAIKHALEVLRQYYIPPHQGNLAWIDGKKYIFNGKKWEEVKDDLG